MSRRELDDRSSNTALASALRALPESAPEPDLWPELARTLEARRNPRRWRYVVPAAIAAGIAIALLLPRVGTHDVTAPRTAPVAAVPQNDTAELAQLHDRSRTLERWIAAVAARAPQDSRDLMAAVEVEDLIGLVDVQLGGARGDADALPLWRQRVALLEDLAAIRGSAFALAENGTGADGQPASLNLN
ncbi:MAG TPA: hypothetical protein VKB52_07940 [Rhodanobacteraceae bacterium]|nr:hypothetical protein [Rhodanobacteraceae bacterium]